jgi:hypothetical protein
MHCGTLPDFRFPVHRQSGSDFTVQLNQSQAMKKIKALLAVLCSLCVLLCSTGCKTSNSVAAQLPRVQTAAKIAAYVGTKEYLLAHPETRPAFVLAADALARLETAPTIGLIDLLEIVNQLPTKELRSERTQMIITSATILLADFAGALPLEQLDELKPVATSIREGIVMALQ